MVSQAGRRLQEWQLGGCPREHTRQFGGCPREHTRLKRPITSPSGDNELAERGEGNWPRLSRRGWSSGSVPLVWASRPWALGL